VCGSDVVVCSWSLLIRQAQRARCQAEIPLIVLCRLAGPALSDTPPANLMLVLVGQFIFPDDARAARVAF
jgi:hypothetical protein